VVNAIALIDIKTPWLTKKGFVAGGAAAVTVAGGLLLGIRLRFHNHTPQQFAIRLAFHQQAADKLKGDDLGRAGEEGLGECWDSLGGYGSGLGDGSITCPQEPQPKLFTGCIPQGTVQVNCVVRKLMLVF